MLWILQTLGRILNFLGCSYLTWAGCGVIYDPIYFTASQWPDINTWNCMWVFWFQNVPLLPCCWELCWFLQRWAVRAFQVFSAGLNYLWLVFIIISMNAHETTPNGLFHQLLLVREIVLEILQSVLGPVARISVDQTWDWQLMPIGESWSV